MNKTYVAPEFETIVYMSEDTLAESNNYNKNGIYNAEGSAQYWSDEDIL